MTARGFDPRESDERNLESVSPLASSVRLFGSVIGMLVGGMLLLGGIVLHFGEKANRLFVFPMAGRLTMLVGMVAFGIGAAFGGRRAAMAVGGFMIVGGIVVYVIGLIYVEQLGNRICQALGLLTTLVGLIAVFATYGMDVPAKPDRPSDIEEHLPQG